QQVKNFQRVVTAFYKKNGRDLPWRKTASPYRVLISEIMLQQTQVDRVLPKYRAFLKRFPTLQKLATASLAEVYRTWQGLGYNTRALSLKRLAQRVVASPA